jgi:tripartite-type tricarboxylate transporter receptor subunit TctC
MRKRTLALVAVAAAAALAGCSSSNGSPSSSGSTASKYPTKPITLIVPFAAGGAADVTARIYASYASQKLGQTVTVQDVTGASGITGAMQAIQSPADGYTLFVDSQGTSATLFATFKSVPFKLDQRTYISQLAQADQYFVVSTKYPYTSLQSLMAFAKANPSQFSWAAGAAGSSVEYGVLQLLNAAGVDISKTKKSIEESGNAAASSAVGSGEVMFSCLSYAEASSLQAAGKGRILAVAADQPDPATPGIPTTASLGYKGADLILFQALAGPPGLPQNVVNAWTQVINSAVSDKATQAAAAKVGNELVAKSGSAMASYVSTEEQQLLPLATESGTRQ